ncbi:hypothetical protein [Xanthomonas citri]|uniref:hypothetical protein n=1 Tax=Xanthomonas citri TaxID=346 RepID=UPI0011AF7B52|nr:hypothetical protein [Xanthomonas citri]
MTIVYGGCVEPGGMELDNDVYSIDCPECGRDASKHSWQRCEGSINHYWSVHCNHCGYRDGNDADDADDEYPPGFWEEWAPPPDDPEDDFPGFARPYEEEGGPSYGEWVNEPGFWKEDRFEESTVEPEPMTAISGPAKAEWVTRDDLVALAQGRPLSFS